MHGICLESSVISTEISRSMNFGYRSGFSDCGLTRHLFIKSRNVILGYEPFFLSKSMILEFDRQKWLQAAQEGRAPMPAMLGWTRKGCRIYGLPALSTWPAWASTAILLAVFKVLIDFSVSSSQSWVVPPRHTEVEKSR